MFLFFVCYFCYDVMINNALYTRCEYIHIWEEKKKLSVLTRWRCCCCLGGEGEDLASSLDGGPLSGLCCPIELRVRGQGLARFGGTSLLFLQWQVRITVSPALLLSSLSFMCSQDFNCKEDRRKKKSNPLLWVCYPSKDTRPLSLWFAVRIELFF